MNEIELDRILQEYTEEVYSCIPKECFDGRGYSGSNFHVRLSDYNGSYEDSKYFYKEEKKFVHWTSIQNLMSIINYREIRLYNLHNSSDPDEFNFAASHLPIENIDHLKKYLYTFSFCKSSELYNNNLWTDYGKDYSGVAIEFEIINSPKEWQKFMISNVYYELPIELIELKIKFEKLKLKYPGINAGFDFGKLISFYKKDCFSKEKEIRISVLYPFLEYEQYYKYCKSEIRIEKNRNRITDYFALNLFVNNDSFFVKNNKQEYDRRQILETDYFFNNPQLKITNIHFGENCGIENTDFVSYRNKLVEIIHRQLGLELNLPFNLFKKEDTK